MSVKELAHEFDAIPCVLQGLIKEFMPLGNTILLAGETRREIVEGIPLLFGGIHNRVLSTRYSIYEETNRDDTLALITYIGDKYRRCDVIFLKYCTDTEIFIKDITGTSLSVQVGPEC